MKIKRELKHDLTKGTMVFCLAFLGLTLLLSVVSASIKDQIREEIKPITIDNETCSSFAYKHFYKNYLIGLVVEISNEEETVYAILNENNCVWDYSFYDTYSKKADITLSGNLGEEDMIIKANTFKGWVIKNKMVDL